MALTKIGEDDEQVPPAVWKLDIERFKVFIPNLINKPLERLFFKWVSDTYSKLAVATSFGGVHVIYIPIESLDKFLGPDVELILFLKKKTLNLPLLASLAHRWIKDGKLVRRASNVQAV